MLGKYAHNKISGGGRFGSVFTKVTDIAEKFIILLLSTRAVWALLGYEKEIHCIGFGQHC